MTRVLRAAPGKVRWIELQLKRGRINNSTYYDRLTELVMQKTLTSRSVCIDVGCYKGSILRLMMSYAPNGTFLAFEPLPHLYEQLLADFEGDAVRVYNLALSQSIGVSTFNYVTSNPAYSGLKKRRYDRPSETEKQIEVATDTLDNIIDKELLPRVSFIKIDVEGAEYLVMKGAERCIKTAKPVIVFEHGLGGADCYGHKPEDIFDLLCHKCGLKISLLSDWLLNKQSLKLDKFCDQFYRGKNYYFIAHR